MRVSVQDDGPGFALAERERAFEPFFTSRRTSGGTGLGLPIARALLAASGSIIAFTDVECGARCELALTIAIQA